LDKIIDISKLTQEEIDAEIQKALDEVAAGRVRSFEDVKDEIEKEYGI